MPLQQNQAAKKPNRQNHEANQRNLASDSHGAMLGLTQKVSDGGGPTRSKAQTRPARRPPLN